VGRRVGETLAANLKNAKISDDAGRVNRRRISFYGRSGGRPVEVSMILLSVRTLLAVSMIVGVTTACASRGSRPTPPPKNTVTAKDIEANPSEPIEKILQAKVPGVWVTRTPDGGIAVKIRGTSSFYGENQPLYVIDGMAINPGPGGALTGVNPHDIESIQVLKDPADTAMYGIRGANGVIVIKTKSPGVKRG
jgi:TonB-dependent SusC/RagA subfamily outer membrane receptor